jgi:antitoxin component YwqK of YwqJK toxin-antitoxin module
MNSSLIDRLQPYHDKGYVFKSCDKEWIVVLKKPDGVLTNEGRHDVMDKQYAKFRGNKLLVIDIVNKFDMSKKTNWARSKCYWFFSVVYKIGYNAEPNTFDENIDNICSSGIHYFMSYESAYYYELEKIIDGEYHCWADNGGLMLSCSYKDGLLDGIFQRWHGNGQLWADCKYKDGKLHGKFHSWHNNNRIYEYDCVYINGKLNGSYFRWHNNGKIMIVCVYENGIINGKYRSWHNNGKLWTEYNYVNGNIDGLYQSWFDNGQPMIKCEYSDGHVVDQSNRWLKN